MTRINTNVPSLRGLRSLNKANDLLNTSMTRLSTGLKINSGKDNPSGLIAGERLRSQTSTIEQSIKNSNRANNVISTADGALGEIGGLLTQVRGLVQEGLNSGALSQDEIEANQLQIDAALSAINRIAANTSFAGDKLIDGSKAFTTNMSTADSAKVADFQVNEALFGSSSQISLDAQITSKAEKASLQYNGGALTGAATVEIGGSKGQEVVFLGGSSSLGNIRDAINGVSDSTGVSARIASGLTVQNAVVANSATMDSTAANSDLVFTDARATSEFGTNASLGGGSVSVVYADPGANDAELSIASATDADGNTTITVNLATNGTGTITSTANDVAIAIGQHAEASKYVSVANAAGNDGTGVVNALGSTALTGGTDAGSISFTDARAADSLGNVNIVFADPGGNNATLGVAVTRSGNDSTITVNLATGATGAITSTLDDIATAIGNSDAAAGLVKVALSGDADSLATAQASTGLAEATGSLVLESNDYGSDQKVAVNVLSGSFDTYSETAGSNALTRTGRDAGADIGVTINGQQAQTKGLKATIKTTTLDASISFAAGSNEVGQAATLNITGGGSLFQIGQDVSASGQIGIGLEAINTARLGGISGKLYELGSTGGKSLVKASKGEANGAELVNIIEQSINRVSTLRGRLGAVQKNVIETNVSTLGVALENISDARSQIVDTDFAEETANMTKGQILSQASISVLAIANQSPSQVLSLLG